MNCSDTLNPFVRDFGFRERHYLYSPWVRTVSVYLHPTSPSFCKLGDSPPSLPGHSTHLTHPHPSLSTGFPFSPELRSTRPPLTTTDPFVPEPRSVLSPPLPDRSLDVPSASFSTSSLSTFIPLRKPRVRYLPPTSNSKLPSSKSVVTFRGSRYSKGFPSPDVHLSSPLPSSPSFSPLL